jgi:type I restriction enzyme S subunit
MKKYDNYKDSGIEWIGEIPEQWIITSLKFLSKIQNGSTPSSSNDEFWNGNINWVTTDDLGKLKNKLITKTKRTITELGYKSCGTSLAPVDSVVISTRAPIGHIGILDIEACSNQGCKTVIPNNINSLFCYFYLLSFKDILESMGQGSTFKELPTSTLKDFKFALPSKEEQTAIAKYLDLKTNQIDQLINQKQRFIELLKEERTVVINQAVTKGLDPTVKMKDSGIEWLGEIPEHWEVKKLKYLISKKIDNRGKTPPFGEIGRPMLEVKQIKDNNIYPSKKFEKFSLQKELIGFIREEVKENDVLIATVGATAGKCCIVPKNSEFFIAQNVIGFRCNSQMDSLFFYYMIESTYFKDSLLAINKSNTIDNLKVSVFINNYCIVPPTDEQIILSKLISDNIDKITKLTRKLNQEIELLKEYKTTLISEVVTGKVDVRDVVLN